MIYNIMVQALDYEGLEISYAVDNDEYTARRNRDIFRYEHLRNGEVITRIQTLFKEQARSIMFNDMKGV